MIKRVIHTAITLAVLLVSCRQDDLLDSMPTAHEGYVALRFSPIFRLCGGGNPFGRIPTEVV